MADHGDQSIGLVEEILEQQSAQALKLSHIDEHLQELKQVIMALGEEGVRSQSGSGAAADHVIDSVERDSAALRGKITWVLGLMGLQTLLLIALVIFAFRPMPRSSEYVAEAHKTVAPAAAPVVEQQIANPFGGATGMPPAKPAEVEEEKPAEKSDKSSKKKKRK